MQTLVHTAADQIIPCTNIMLLGVTTPYINTENQFVTAMLTILLPARSLHQHVVRHGGEMFGPEASAGAMSHRQSSGPLSHDLCANDAAGAKEPLNSATIESIRDAYCAS